MASTVNDRFILAEEAALKAKVAGLQVTYPKLADVDVWFRWPNKEVRTVTYPFISLDLVDISKSEHREHQGDSFVLDQYIPPNYEPTLPEDPNVRGIVADEWPTPYDLVWTITVVSLDPRHDRELKYKLLGDRDRLPTRWAYLDVGEGDYETRRRLDVLDVDSSTRRDENVTEFCTIFTLNVEAELFPGQIKDVYRVYDSIRMSIHAIGTDITEEITTTVPEPEE